MPCAGTGVSFRDVLFAVLLTSALPDSGLRSEPFICNAGILLLYAAAHLLYLLEKRVVLACRGTPFDKDRPNQAGVNDFGVWA